MQALVTRVDSFIGSHLTEMLVSQGYQVKALSQYNSFNNWGWLEDVNCKDQIEILTGDIRDPHYCKHITKDVDIIFRPKKLATDEACTESALLYVCDELEKQDNFIPDIVLTLEPTSPMRTAATIINSVDILKKQNFDSVIGVVESRSVFGKIVN